MRIKGMKNKFVDLSSIPNFKETLIDMYVNNKISLNEIAKRFSVSPYKIKNELSELGIGIRSRKEAYSIKPN